MIASRTQVAIIGAGPAGLLLGHLLRQAGIKAIIVERQTREYVEGRIRAGVLETVTTNLLRRLDLASNLDAQGLPHDGFELHQGDRSIRIDIHRLIGQRVTVYGQTEIVHDLIEAAPDRDLEIIWEAEDVSLHDVSSDAPFLTFRHHQEDHRIACSFIAGCDGFHGPSRQAIPKDLGRAYERIYPFGWLGILADVPPCNHELIYASHEKGFALASMRSPSRSRYYIQVPSDERIEDWPDSRLWDALEDRLGKGVAVTRGPAIEKSIAPLRSYIHETMNHGRLFLAGDAAHIVPPTGAKGLNLAASDVVMLSDALIAHFARGDEGGLVGYPARALSRIWKASRFSWYLTSLMHRFPDSSDFDRRIQLAELDYIADSEAAQTSIAENYVGLSL